MGSCPQARVVPDSDHMTEKSEVSLMGAVAQGTLGMVKALLAKRPDMNMQNKQYGYTVLMLAIEKEQSFDIVKALLAHIGKYLSGLRKLDHVLVLKAGFETQL